MPQNHHTLPQVWVRSRTTSCRNLSIFFNLATRPIVDVPLLLALNKTSKTPTGDKRNFWIMGLRKTRYRICFQTVGTKVWVMSHELSNWCPCQSKSFRLVSALLWKAITSWFACWHWPLPLPFQLRVSGRLWSIPCRGPLGPARLSRWDLRHHLPGRRRWWVEGGWRLMQCCDSMELKNPLTDVTLPHAALQSDGKDAP